ncbi:hypothetical protein H2201_004389 [Coniosporium apollinis]|uniref:WD40 repeat-like protein n=1 Tax=Coniosporium apollinis TaxID=61459 RepID=A0ABQ9NSX7_9PEZI|nr:hypothetical protein H2201_004389 [Coniosporium apollinis]
MKYSLYDRLYKRELGSQTVYSEVPGIYGDRQWIKDLDIINELDGHSGCVNALSWSKSGRLLASGSDDQHVNIHSYLPDSSTSQFALTTAIATGHRQNIFSVKFMPHSNDRIIVSAAGDGEVRIFDIEYSGRSTVPSSMSNLGSGRRRNIIYNGVRYLSEGETNAKVYRSHSDRVKRIVTESSPYFFLTCSEDGEVRQWDIRQPSSAYPAPRDIRGSYESSEDNVPPPLISYKRYHLDLNTISCSPSQPHYIALGGAHLHCFLHDRRMLGRDRLRESGRPISMSGSFSEHDNELMGQATQCVRKFAPNGQKRMRRTDNGHITACKISDANPNEMVVSWSGEWIYSFDLIRSPDASEQQSDPAARSSSDRRAKAKESKVRKRKRAKTAESVTSQEAADRSSSRARTSSSAAAEGSTPMALMVQYENGQSEEIPIEPPRPRSPVSEVREAVLPEAQRRSFRIAKASVKLRKHMFTLDAKKDPTDADPTGYATSFTSVLGFAASILPEMDEISRTWRYPVNPSPIDATLQRTLRANRCSSRRFVQAAGALARLLRGKLRTAGGTSPALALFSQITPAPNELPEIPRHEHFGYDFLKAILLWLDSGVGALLEGFTRPPTVPPGHPRFPVPDDAGIEAVDEVLIPYLLRLADEKPIMNVDASRFEVDENRQLFASEKAAVVAFAQAVKIPFADLSSAVVRAEDAGGEVHASAQDRKAALRYWAFRVGRGVLMNAGQGVNFAFVDRAFGGLGTGDKGIEEEEEALRTRFEDVGGEEEEAVRSARVVRRSEESGSSVADAPTPTAGTEAARQPTVEEADDADTEMEDVVLPLSEISEIISANTDDVDDEDEEDQDDDVDVDGHEAEESEEEEESDTEEDSRYVWRSAFERRRLREGVELDVPCSPHTRVYKGHCNVKTVKDVNFYGLNDEYVVSGSDSGHLFIWDKKTSQLLNILEGDGEVVNVVQGHPYEPLLAVSGIDHTIKIFSPDARARHDAIRGIGVTAADASTFSSLGFGRSRMRRRAAPTSAATGSTDAEAGPARPENHREDRAVDEGGSSDDERAQAPNGLPSRRRMHMEYQITSQNDVDRRGGNRDAFITRSMLAQLAARIQARQMAGEGGGEGEEGVLVIEGEDCVVM